MVWDLIVVGAGPAGAATALGALTANPGMSVLMLDRHDFPRDKACGDGIAPHVFDLLAEVGVTGLVDDRTPIRRLVLRRGQLSVDRLMERPAWVVPRLLFDQRLVEAAQAAGAELRRHRVRSVEAGKVDDFEARVIVGADGAHSLVRRSVGAAPGPTALALRGYAPTPDDRAEQQAIVFGTATQPSYAWSFDRGDGWSNVGYGELLSPKRARPTRADLLTQLEVLLPGATAGGTDWRGHHLPLSTWSWRPQSGNVLLVGDAAGLINPMTGEGIYYAVATGLLAGRAAAAGGDAGSSYRRSVRKLLGRHLRHTALAARLTRSGFVLDAGIKAAATDQAVFDDLVEIGLADGHLQSRTIRGLVGESGLLFRGRG